MKTWHMPGYETRQWNYCRGSSPQYRGYTCGLWTVFHCLSVGATQHSFTASIDTLLAIRGYVEHFFGCKNCARHFLLVAATTTDSSLADHGAAGPMLWLWQTHNAANARIGS